MQKEEMYKVVLAEGATLKIVNETDRPLTLWVDNGSFIVAALYHMKTLIVRITEPES